MTGKNPGKHGIYGFAQPKGTSYEMELANGGLCRAKTLWRLLSERGRSVGVLNVPMTFPPAPVNGFLIAGFDTPHSSMHYTYPSHLRQEIEAAFGRYTFFPPIVGVELKGVVNNLIETIDLRVKVARYLFERYSCDFFMVAFNATDTMQHLCLGEQSGEVANDEFLSAILRIYQLCDAFVDETLNRMSEDTTLVVMSDHGAGTLNKYVHLNSWLASFGLLRYRRPVAGSSAGDSGIRIRKALRGAWEQTVTSAKRSLPLSLRKRLRRYLGLKARADTSLALDTVDWDHTLAYTCRTGGIYLNVAGRQPHGIVQPGSEYDRLCDTIATSLLSLTDPGTDQGVVERVSRKDELFHGPHVDNAPDLYIHWKNDAYLGWFDMGAGGDSFFSAPRALSLDDVVPPDPKAVSVGNHRREGVLMMAGAPIVRGSSIDDAQIVDLAPTILHLMGEALDADMDGRVLDGALTEAFASEHRVVYEVYHGQTMEAPESVYLDEEKEEMLERLRHLGYFS